MLSYDSMTEPQKAQAKSGLEPIGPPEPRTLILPGFSPKVDEIVEAHMLWFSICLELLLISENTYTEAGFLSIQKGENLVYHMETLKMSGMRILPDKAQIYSQ